MPKITEEELTALQIRLFTSDLQYLRTLYGKEFGVNKAVRTIVRAFVNQTKAAVAKQIDKMPTNLDLI